MRSIKLVALGLVGGVTIVSAASEVTSLTKDTFEGFVKDSGLVLAKFFAPWCGHCQKLAPEFEEAAVTLKEKNIKLVKIDCAQEASFCHSEGIDGYPTLKIYNGLKDITPYSGARTASGIVSHMMKRSLPAISLLTKETIEDFKTAAQVVLVAYFAADDITSNQIFTTAAEKLRDSYFFGASNDADLASNEGVKFPAIVLYKSFDEGKVIYNGDFSVEEIEKFAITASIPLVGDIGPETYSNYVFTRIPLAYIFAHTEEERKSLSNSLRPVAEKYRGKVNFATIDADAFGAHAGNLNLKTDKFPAFAIQETVNNKKYPFDQENEFTVEEIEKHVSLFVEGKLEPSIKSEPVPESQKGPVTVVVANNFDEIVMDDNKDVLIEFYAPWCAHCKALAPKYDKLGQLYIDFGLTDKITIAKVDATANDVPEDIEGFPTIMLFKAQDKGNPVTYTGPRSINDLVEFVKQGKHQVSVEYKSEAEENETEQSEEEILETPEDTDKDDLPDHDEL